MGRMTSQATATILSGASLSAAIYLGDKVIQAVQMPSAWTAASLTFQSSADGATYNDVYDSQGNEWTVTTAASRYIPLEDLAFTKSFLYLRIRSGTTGTPVTQGADRAIQVFTRRI